MHGEGEIYSVIPKETKKGTPYVTVKIMERTLEKFIYIDIWRDIEKDDEMKQIHEEIQEERVRAEEENRPMKRRYVQLTVSRLDSWTVNGKHGIQMSGDIKVNKMYE